MPLTGPKSAAVLFAAALVAGCASAPQSPEKMSMAGDRHGHCAGHAKMMAGAMAKNGGPEGEAQKGCAGMNKAPDAGPGSGAAHDHSKPPAAP